MDTKFKTYYLLFFLGLTFWSCQEKPASTQYPAIEKSTPAQQIMDTLPTRIIQAAAIPTIPLDYDTSLWTDLAQSDPAFQMDIRYATSNNFVEEQLYDCPRCFLRPEAASALDQVHAVLLSKGYGIQLFDCYRPKSVQEKLWQKVSNATYVTPPHKGSMHNRGYAIDLTLTREGQALDMGSPFDFFGRQAHHDYYDLDQDVLDRRQLLRSTMADHGFQHIRTEWWHYSYKGPYHSPFEIADFEWSCH